jgi:hypothetical protein
MLLPSHGTEPAVSVSLAQKVKPQTSEQIHSGYFKLLNSGLVSGVTESRGKGLLCDDDCAWGILVLLHSCSQSLR